MRSEGSDGKNDIATHGEDADRQERDEKGQEQKLGERQGGAEGREIGHVGCTGEQHKAESAWNLPDQAGQNFVGGTHRGGWTLACGKLPGNGESSEGELEPQSDPDKQQDPENVLKGPLEQYRKVRE